MRSSQCSPSRSPEPNPEVKQVAQKEKVLEKMERLKDPSLELEHSKVKLSFPDPGKLRKPSLVQLDEVRLLDETYPQS